MTTFFIIVAVIGFQVLLVAIVGKVIKKMDGRE